MTHRQCILIDKYDVISFDMFDTLITRNLNEPSEIFDFIQKQINKRGLNIEQFKLKRINAEHQARLKNKIKKQDITLDCIYEVFSNYYNIDYKIAEQIKNIEIKMEENICEINREGYELYQYCIKKNKTIVICTDMYLPKRVIEEILSQNKIVYYKLYLSNDIGYTKAFKGILFKYIVQDLNINKRKILHVGDNWKSDIIFSQLNGIYSLHISSKNHCTIYDKKNKKAEYRVLNNFINNHIESKKDYYWKIGYQVLGPLLYGFSVWLSEKMKDEKPDKIFFLSRDGFIMQKAFNIVNPNIKNKYIYASRKALIVPILWMHKNPENLVDIMKFPRWIKIANFLDRMGLEPQKYELHIKKYGYQMNTLINMEKEVKKSNFKNLWYSIFDDIKENSLNLYDNAFKYFKEIGLNGKAAVVDIGWNGYLQQAMEQIINAGKIDADIQGYYLGVQIDSDVQEKQNMHGYLFKKNYNEDICLKLTFCRSLLESFFIADHGSVKRYEKDKIEFLDFEYENTKSLNVLRKVQDGAIKFVEDFVNYQFSSYISIDAYTAVTNFLYLGNRPKQLDVKNLGEILFLDDELRCLLPQEKRWKYLFNIKKFMYDLKFSAWGTGLLKKIFIINTDFFTVAMKLRSIYYGKDADRKRI